MSMKKSLNLEILKPTAEYLTHPLVLAQAWKKSHQYIRRTSWLADTFELDRSAILLDENLKQWKSELVEEEVPFDQLVLVPAPKTGSWKFHEIDNVKAMDESYPFKSVHEGKFAWAPSDLDDPVPMRPLAHVSIRDQSYMTALMMCLANTVESSQGDTGIQFDKVHESRVVNYGNRLYCEFRNNNALFSWGSSNTYSQYYSDYKLFLERPAYFAKKELQSILPGENVYEVHLDIEKFYDKVSRAKLIKKIKSLADAEDTILNVLLDKFKDWKWEKGADTKYANTCIEKGKSKAPLGIPQGLVSGGFFANVYLMDFDEHLANEIGGQITKDCRLVDYCRYVDDMRLVFVVGGDEADAKSTIINTIESVVESKLLKLNLKLKDSKTKIELFRKRVSNVSIKLKGIQEKVSGPLSTDEIDEQLGHLEGLIGLAETIGLNHGDETITNPLARVEGMALDVREDTLLRFSANKIHKLLQDKRSLVSQEIDDLGNAIPGNWDFLQERMARKFIASWSRDPSLVLMLKKGLEMFPDPRLLKPVLSQLKIVLERDCKIQAGIAAYCIGEIFRHSAIVVNNKNEWSFPAHANIDVFYSILCEYADDCIVKSSNYSPYLILQAKLLLLLRDKIPSNICGESDLYKSIYQMKFGMRNVDVGTTVQDALTSIVLAYQLASNKDNVINSIDDLLGKLPGVSFLDDDKQLRDITVSKLLQRIALVSSELFEDLVVFGINSKRSWIKSCQEIIDMSGVSIQAVSGELARFDSDKVKYISLLSVIKRTDNPFLHENAVLLLIKALLEKTDEIDGDIDLTKICISCNDWNNLQSLQPSLSLRKGEASGTLFTTDNLHEMDDDELKLYRIGMLIRSCLLGRIDWTGGAKLSAVVPGYRGINTSYHKRRIGMMHSPEGLQGDASPMTGWLSGLLSCLLKWPGVKPINDLYSWPSNLDIDGLKYLIEGRIKQQKNYFCELSKIPGYVEKVKLDWSEDKKDLNVIMVQSLLPLKRDFANFGLILDDPKFRAKHRKHVASVAELILHKIMSQNAVNDEGEKKKLKVDLIVWPELSVHKDDIDILNRLSDKTGAMIFAGLGFVNQPNVPGPNNCAIWIVPKKTNNGRHFLYRLQGKRNMTKPEDGKVIPWRPYQFMLELVHPAFPNDKGFILTGSICYDATDIKLNADLKDKSDAYIVSALNQDVSTFDSMVDSLYYHMYQHVVLVNTGEFGGSVAKAPYKERHHKLITHVHGTNQVSISSFEMNMFDFRDIGSSYTSGKKTKTKPAGA
jgi:hypothetical protein